MENNHTEILKMKNTIAELRDSLVRFNNELDQVEEKVSKCDDKSFEITESEGQKKKKLN